MENIDIEINAMGGTPLSRQEIEAIAAVFVISMPRFRAPKYNKQEDLNLQIRRRQRNHF
jgi:hypothetical protein